MRVSHQRRRAIVTGGASGSGWPGVALHILRHSAARGMLTHGVPLAVVSQGIEQL